MTSPGPGVFPGPGLFPGDGAGPPAAPPSGPFVRLPPGRRPPPVPFTPLDVVTATRVTRYRFDLLDGDENLIGTMDGVEPGGWLEWHAFAGVKGTGSLPVLDTGQAIDWLNVRVRPVIIMGVLGIEDEVETPLGVFLPAAPQESWVGETRRWTVELADKNSIPDSDIATDVDDDPYAYTAPIGANAVQLATALLQATGEATPAIQPDDDAVLPMSLAWETGDTLLSIINDLLSAAGYNSLWCDGNGQYQMTPYVEPGEKGPVYETITPFSKGELSQMSPEWGRERNIYAIPNRYVLTAPGDGEDEGLQSVAVNVDPDNEFSYPSRGRWITRVVQNEEVLSQAVLDTRSRQGLSQSMAVTSGITIEHLYLPLLQVNEALRFRNPDAGLDLLCTVTVTTVPLDPVGLCKSEVREVISCHCED